MTRPTQTNTTPPTIALISLGCAKNTVDSECILGSLISGGLLIAEDPADADICLVNTCGFIDDARAEAAEGGAPEARAKAWSRALSIAASRGHAVVIGHPNPATVEFLAARLPELEKRGVLRARVSELVD